MRIPCELLLGLFALQCPRQWSVLAIAAAPAPNSSCLPKQGLPWPGFGTLFCCGGSPEHPALKSCGPANQQCCAVGSHSSDGGAGTSPCATSLTPQYHIKDRSCAMNDPNGPFYDPLHRIYHVFWQAHLAQPDPVKKPGAGPAVGPVYGHAVSHDLITWARLPVALWNDEYYDSKALYTGSTTMVDGNPVLVYPGISDPPTGGTLNVAVPANRSDPLLEKWAKSAANPLMTGTSDDPSTAWLTAQGEWRFVGQSVATASGNGMPLYSGGSNLSAIHLIGVFDSELGGDCMSIFPLPPTVNGSSDWFRSHSDQTPLVAPTHVMIQSSQFKLGVLKDAPVGKMSSWTNSFSFQLNQSAQSSPKPGFARLELGARYADKDFADPVRHRRLLWGWAVIDEGSMGLLRELRYDARLGNALVKAPLEELKALREMPALASVKDDLLPQGGHLWLGNQLLTAQAGRQSELRLSFVRPKTAVVLGVDIMAGSMEAAQQESFQSGAVRNESQRVYIVYEPSARDVRVGIADGSRNITALENHTAFVGGTLETVMVNGVAECRAHCRAQKGACAAWSLNQTAQPFSCSLKRPTGWQVKQDPTTDKFTSGVICAPQLEGCGIPGVDGVSDSLTLLPSDEMLELAVYIDNTILEVYWQGGRVAMTLALRSGPMTGMDLFCFSNQREPTARATVGASVHTAEAWRMRSIWTTADQILAQAVASSSSQQ